MEPERFQELVKNIPKSGVTLMTESKSPCPVFIEKKENGRDVCFCYAKVSESGKWVLHGERFGLVCLIAMFSTDAIHQDSVCALKVLRTSRTGRSLVCQAMGY